MIRPHGDHLVVSRDEHTFPPDVSGHYFKGGRLVMPDTAKARSREGTVLAVGPDVEEDIRKGDRVAITWHEGTPYEDEHMGKVEIFLESEILMVLGRT